LDSSEGHIVKKIEVVNLFTIRLSAWVCSTR